jgi:hypothetical protein
MYLSQCIAIAVANQVGECYMRTFYNRYGAEIKMSWASAAYQSGAIGRAVVNCIGSLAGHSGPRNKGAVVHSNFYIGGIQIQIGKIVYRAEKWNVVLRRDSGKEATHVCFAQHAAMEPLDTIGPHELKGLLRVECAQLACLVPSHLDHCRVALSNKARKTRPIRTGTKQTVGHCVPNSMVPCKV